MPNSEPPTADCGAFGGGGEGAEGQRPGLEAHAAGFAALDDDDAGAQPARRLRDGKAGRTRADDAEIGG